MTLSEKQTTLWRSAASGSLQDVLGEAAELTQCAFVLGDPILSVRAAACQNNGEGWSWEDYIRAGYAPDFLRDHRSSLGWVEFSDRIEGWHNVLQDNGRACCLLDLNTRGGNCWHLSITHASEAFLLEQLDVIDVATQALLAVIDRSTDDSDHQVTLERFLSRLLDGDARETEMIEVRCRLLDFPSDGFFTLLTVDVGSYRPTDSSLSTVAKRLEALGNAVSVVHGRRLVLLQRYRSEEELNDPDHLAALAECLRSNGLIGARSRAFFLLRDVPVHFTQTEELLRLSYCARSESLLDFSVMASRLLAAKLPIEEQRISACHPAVRRLAELDQDSKFGYIETLKIYLLCSQRAALACRKLHVHRNTLDYRLHRIEEQVHIDWTDGEQLFQMLFSIRLLEVLEHPL